MNKFSELKDREGGFTLIELLVVIIIIGILAAIAIPLFLDQRKLAIDASVKSDVRNTVTNVTTAQATSDVNYAGAVTSGNTISLTTLGTGGKTYAVAAGKPTVTGGVATDAQNPTPANGTDFTVIGYNAGGKSYTAATTGKAYQFSTQTGQFGTN